MASRLLSKLNSLQVQRVCFVSFLIHVSQLNAIFPLAKPFTVTANNEVILSAGSVGSAQILLLSGIGNGTELRAVGVTPLVNLPDVGRNLQDHPIMTNYWNVSSNQTYDDVLRNPAILGADLNQWETTHTGLFSASSVPGIGFIRLPSNASIFESTPDPAAGACERSVHLLCAHIGDRTEQRSHGTPVLCAYAVLLYWLRRLVLNNR